MGSYRSNSIKIRTSAKATAAKSTVDEDFYDLFDVPENYYWHDDEKKFPFPPAAEAKILKALNDLRAQALQKNGDCDTCRFTHYIGKSPRLDKLFDVTLNWIGDNQLQLVVLLDNRQNIDDGYNELEICVNERPGMGISIHRTCDITPVGLSTLKRLLRRIFEEPENFVVRPYLRK